MSWTDIHVVAREPLTEVLNVRTGRVTARAGIVYYVAADAPFTMDQALVASFGGVAIPSVWSSYSASRPFCVCSQREVTWISQTQAHVRCGFEDPSDGSSGVALLAQRAKIDFSTEANSRPYTIDSEANPVVNAAGEPFTNLPESQAGVKIYSIVKFVNSTVRAQIKSAWNTNNDHTVTVDGDTWAADELWLADSRFRPVDGESATIWEANLTVKGKPGGWKDVCLNVGYRGRTTITGPGGGPRVVLAVIKKERDTITNEWMPCSTPWPLDEYGAALDVGGDGSPPTPGQLYFWPYTRHPWTGVPLA